MERENILDLHSGKESLESVDRNQKGDQSASLFSRRIRFFFRTPTNWLALSILFLFVIASFVPIAWLPHNPTFVSPGQRHSPPFWQTDLNPSFPLGTDHLGRDMISRLIYSARYTFLVMTLTVALSTISGISAGLLSGYYGGVLEIVINRLVDIQLSIPIILLAIASLAVVGSGFINLIIILALFDWARYARIVHSATISVKNNTYIEAVRALGAPSSYILLKHILPNIISPILVLITFAMSRVLLAESALSFLGLGVTPPQSTWGGMISDGRNYIYEAWWTSAIPGLAISLAVLSINLVGDGIRDSFDTTIDIDRSAR